MTAVDLARLNALTVFSQNLISVWIWFADSYLLTHSRLVCLAQNCFIWTVTFTASEIGLLRDWIKNKEPDWDELESELCDVASTLCPFVWNGLLHIRNTTTCLFEGSVYRQLCVCKGVYIVEQTWRNHLITADTSDCTLPRVLFTLWHLQV